MKYRTANQISLGALLVLVAILGFVPNLILNVISRHNDTLTADIESMKGLHAVYDNFQETALSFDQYIIDATGSPETIIRKIDEHITSIGQWRELASGYADHVQVADDFIRNFRLFKTGVINYQLESEYDPTGDGALQMEQLAVTAKTQLTRRLTSFMQSVLETTGKRNNRMYDDINRLSNISVLGLAVGLACGLFIAVLLRGAFARPIRVLTEGALRLSSGELTHRIKLKSFEEFNQLGDTFNSMADHLLGTLEEEKKMTAELGRKNEALRQASRMKSEFLANISHEIRTPLNGVIGISELLSYTRLNNEQHEFVKTIQESGTFLLMILNDLLDLSKIEAGKLEFESIDFDLHEVIDHVCDIMAPQAHEKGLELVSSVGRKIPSGLRGDPYRLRQVLTNLIGNAVKFTEKGEVAMRTSLTDEEETRVHLRFSVCDTGIGIPEDRKDCLFQSFSQVDGSTTRRYGGTGLGLTISKQLVEMMGGDIGVESTPGQGTEFWFTLPFEKQPDGGPIEHEIPDPFQDNRIFVVDDNAVNLHVRQKKRSFNSAKSLIDPASGRSAKFNILLVEDNITNQKLAQAALNILGYRYEAVSNGKEALDALAENAYDLILMDCQMPVMDGYETTRVIRSDRSGKFDSSVPIVAMTAHAMEGDRDKCLNAGMDGYLTKPVQLKLMAEALQKWLPDTTDGSDIPAVVSEMSTPSGDFDYEGLLELTGGNKELADEILEDFLEDFPETIAAVKKGLENGDAAAIQHEAHALKGVSANVRASGIECLARQLEAAAKAADFERTTMLLRQLVKEMDRLHAFLRKHEADAASRGDEDSGV